MSTGADALADRLRANLRAAEIPAADVDVERIVDEGSLSRIEPYLRAFRETDRDVEPDYPSAFDATPGASGEPAISAAGDASAPPPVGGDLPDTVRGVAPLLRDGAVSPVELVERALARVAEWDGALNAFQLVLVERARKSAREAEAEIRKGGWRGPLHGVPVAVKDLFAMAGTVTTAGSRRAAWPPEAGDAAAVARLERAGAVILGKTRLPEFAFWPGSMNPHYGPTANPRDLGRDAGGSSSGSAAAVADGMAYAALGSDTGGSIRIPAALCGVIGLKPTYGRVSLEGCIPLAWSLDHAGPLTRCVDDAGLLLDTLAGGGGGAARESSTDRPLGSTRLRVGVLRADGTDRPLGSDEALEQWTQSLGTLAGAGAVLVDVELPEMAILRAVNFLILSAEASAYHAAGLRSHYDEYGEPCRSRLLTGFAYDAHDLVQAQRMRRAIRARWGTLFEQVDVLSTPSQPDVAPPLGEMASVKFTSPFNALGWPAISVPWGSGSGGLPLATQLIGAPGRDAALLRVAKILEETR